MGSLIVLLVILGCVVYQYLRGTLVDSFAMVIISICAGAVAFSYFEPLANILINRKFLANWAHTISFMLLFILAFAALQAIAAYLTRKPVDFGMLPERIGRVIFGIFLGLIVSGFLLTAIAMAPLSPKYPYQRFDQNNPNPEQPGGVLLNADGFATGWFNIISSGSFSGKKSFAVLHTDFLNQLFLTRHGIESKVSTVILPEIMKKPRDAAVWPAPEDLKDTAGEPVPPKNGHDLTIVRMGLTSRLTVYGGTFTLSQVRLICKQKGDKNPFAGKAKNIYPIGYLKTENELEAKKLTDIIRLYPDEYINNLKEFDFVFYVPDGFVPVLIEFKRNCISQLPPPVKYEEAPPMQQPPTPEDPNAT